jgi:hypothetical protein
MASLEKKKKEALAPSLDDEEEDGFLRNVPVTKK